MYLKKISSSITKIFQKRALISMRKSTALWQEWYWENQCARCNLPTRLRQKLFQSARGAKHQTRRGFFCHRWEFEKQGRSEQIVCSLKKGQKKILKRNGKMYDKFSDHIGFIPLVIISPADRDLIAAKRDASSSTV
jgi:hypothetical protein